MKIVLINEDVFDGVEELQMGATLASFYGTKLDEIERKFYTVPLNSIVYIEQEKKP